MDVGGERSIEFVDAFEASGGADGAIAFDDEEAEAFDPEDFADPAGAIFEGIEPLMNEGLGMEIEGEDAGVFAVPLAIFFDGVLKQGALHHGHCPLFFGLDGEAFEPAIGHCAA